MMVIVFRYRVHLGEQESQRLNQKQEYFTALLTCLFQELVELSLDEVLVSLSLVIGEGDEGDGQGDSSSTVLIIVRSTGSSTCPWFGGSSSLSANGNIGNGNSGSWKLKIFCDPWAEVVGESFCCLVLDPWAEVEEDSFCCFTVDVWAEVERDSFCCFLADADVIWFTFSFHQEVAKFSK